MRRLLVVLLLAALGCSPGADAGDPAPEASAVRVAAAADAETTLLAHVAVGLLAAEGLDAEVVEFSGAGDTRQALELDAVDVRIGYTGESWLETLGRADPPGDPRTSVAAVRDHDVDQGIVWLRPRYGEGRDAPPANATFSLAVMGPPGRDADLRSVSELATRLSEEPEARVCVDREFGSRTDGLRAVLEAYSVRSDRPFLAATPEEAVLGVAAGDCVAGLTTATDGLAWRAGLQPLVDDLGVFPAFVVLPQVRAELLEERPEARVALTPMANELTNPLLARANAEVVGGSDVEAVAEDLVAELRRRDGRDVEDEADA